MAPHATLTPEVRQRLRQERRLQRLVPAAEAEAPPLRAGRRATGSVLPEGRRFGGAAARVSLGLMLGGALAALPLLAMLPQVPGRDDRLAVLALPSGAQAFGSPVPTDAPLLHSASPPQPDIRPAARARPAVEAEVLSPPVFWPEASALDPVAGMEDAFEIGPMAADAQPEQGTAAPAAEPAPLLMSSRPPDRSAGDPDAPWRRYAVGAAAASGRPQIAIVIDDCGLDRRRTQRAAQLPGQITMAFLPYAGELAAQTRFARSEGQEVMLHMPMQPLGAADPGPQALTVDLAAETIIGRLNAALAAVPFAVAVNNHMGSRATADARVMDTVTRELARSGYGFLDSRTSSKALGFEAAAALGMPRASRDVFLDHEMTPAFVESALAKLEHTARAHGVAVAIGHPHGVTLDALERWIPEAEARGFQLVPITAVMARELQRNPGPVAAATGTAAPARPGG